jgi:hypothetical protein
VLIVTVLALAIGVVALWMSARNAITVCVLEVRGGTVRIARGALAPGILSDIADVVARPRVRRATLRIVRNEGLARLDVSGEVSPEQRQQLRNVVGSVPLAKLATGRRS